MSKKAYLSTMFSLMLKPAGSRCNLHCAYCYYIEKPAGERMSLPVLEKVISEYTQACDGEELNFIWHGGEPLLMGLDWFLAAVELERKYAGGRYIFNSIQTNGTLLNSAWAAFFRECNFLVGLSLDGPAGIHERFRLGSSGTFDKVMAGLRCLQDAGVQFNTLTTVNSASEGCATEIYSFLKKAGSRHMQFLPVVSEEKAGPWCISAEGYGRFMSDIFDVWVKEDVGRIFVQMFDAALSSWCGLSPGVCTMSRSCAGAIMVDSSGDLYPCDHLVTPKRRLGNVLQTPMSEILAQSSLKDFWEMKFKTLPLQCRDCEWKPACFGGCPAHRDPVTGINRLCEGYRLFFEHAAPALDRMQALLSAGRAPSEIVL